MKGHLIMSAKERSRKAILEKVKEKYITLHEASIQMRVSYRQAKRIWKRYRSKEDQGLIHLNRGNTAVGHGFKEVFKEEVIQIYQTTYEGFGPTLASEKLAKQGIILSRETLRSWLIEAKLWQRHRKRKAHKQRRERRSRFGELLQIDGSIHDWFGTEKGKYCLLNLVDDATTTTLSLMAEGETTEVVLRVLKSWIERYGIPQAIYVDRKSVYLGEQGNSVFEQVCKSLGIEVIAAHSAQAKGRVERNHAVYQDRFVKELKLRKITTVEKANELLTGSFVKELNEKFAKEPLSKEDAHSPLLDTNLDEIFVWRHKRQLQNDWTISFQNKVYQIEDKAKQLRAKQKIDVILDLKGTIQFFNQKELLSYSLCTLSHRKAESNKEEKSCSESKRSENGRKGKAKSPWNQFNPNWLGGKKKGDIIGLQK